MRTYNDRVFQLNRIKGSNIEQFIKYYDLDVISEDDFDQGSSGSTHDINLSK